jgi:UDP-GlcNAc:undecaprenyl-phosphate GlcNAc-1-phosphate transferase
MSMAYIFLPLVSLVVGFRARAIGTWLGVVDHPDIDRKTHSSATPLVGGLAITAPFLMASAQQLWEGPDSSVSSALMIAVGGAFLLGFFDDREPLPASFRFLATIVLVLVSLIIVPTFMVANFDFSFLREAIPLHSFSVIFTVLVVVGMMNAVNMADGMNGLVCGLCLIWSVFLLFYAPPQVAPILMVLAICLFVTMVFNLRGLLFLGDSGAYASGIAISLLMIHTYNTTSGTLHADVVVVWFIVPVLDCLRLIITRISEHRSPGSADADHLHHRLQNLLPRWGALFSYWALVAVPGALVIAMPSLAPAMVLAVFGIYLGVLVLTSAWVAGRLRGRAVSKLFRAAPRPGVAGGLPASSTTPVKASPAKLSSSPSERRSKPGAAEGDISLDRSVSASKPRRGTARKEGFVR